MAVKRLDDMPPDARPAPAVQVRLLKRVEDVELKVLDVDRHGFTPFHSHPHGHEGVVVAGKGALRFGDRSELLAAGDVFSIDPNEPHAIECHDAQRLRLVCVDYFIE